MPSGDGHELSEQQPEPERVLGYWKYTLLRSMNFAFSSLSPNCLDFLINTPQLLFLR